MNSDRNRDRDRDNRDRERDRDRDRDRNRDGDRNRDRDRQRNQESHHQYEYGKKEIKKEKEEEPVKEKEKPSLLPSGNLAKDTNTFNGVVIKYNEPPEARKPIKRWRLYCFKGDTELPFYPVHRQSAYLIGRDRLVADIPVDHPSCSKQHSVFQYRLVEYKRKDGTTGRTIKPYIIDLGSTNGTYVNNNRIESQRFYELREKDVIKFGFSSREYVLLHEESKNDLPLDDDDADISPNEDDSNKDEKIEVKKEKTDSPKDDDSNAKTSKKDKNQSRSSSESNSSSSDSESDNDTKRKKKKVKH